MSRVVLSVMKQLYNTLPRDQKLEFADYALGDEQISIDDICNIIGGFEDEQIRHIAKYIANDPQQPVNIIYKERNGDYVKYIVKKAEVPDKTLLFKELKEPYFTWVDVGVKTYEGRLASKIKEWDLKVGRQICFHDGEGKNRIIVIVKSIITFYDFGQAWDIFGEKLIPCAKSREEVIDLYNSFYKYPGEVLVPGKPSQMILDNGVVAIGIERV